MRKLRLLATLLLKTMRNSPFWIIIIGLMLLLDFYVFQAIKVVSQPAGYRTRSIIYISYWSLSVLALLTFLLLPILNLDSYSKSLRSVVFALIAALFFAKLAAAVYGDCCNGPRQRFFLVIRKAKASRSRIPSAVRFF